ncbi:MAG: hypothetical protein INQ03_22995 [Candidatus Heimdallarchaeota archaeon]|nr:hypothetical protein [Candidatus Heimdallarchaeota archaeon]
MEIEYLNLGSEFLKFYNKAKEKPEFASELYDEIVAPLSPGFDKLIKSSITEKNFENAMKNFEDIEDIFSQYAEKIPNIIESSTHSFKKFFPDFSIKNRVLIVHSFGQFDGGIRMIDGRRTLCFGLDVISRIHRGTDITPLIHHELFHLYHYTKYKLLNEAWEAFYFEGLATYITHIMNPEATAAQLLLTLPKGLIDRVDKNRVKHKEKILKEINVKDDQEFYDEYFIGPFSETRYRAGYYIGFLFCHSLAQNNSLSSLLKPEDLKQRMISFFESDFLDYPTFSTIINLKNK